MFSFRRRSSKKGQENDETPQLKSSPSLPKLPSQEIPWPENLVDVAAIREESGSDEALPKGAAKTSFQGVDLAPVSFHKPFRGSPGKSIDGEVNGGTISSLYMSHPPSSFEISQSSKSSPAASRPSQRRTRQPPTFNLMVRHNSSGFSQELRGFGSGCGRTRHGEDVFFSVYFWRQPTYRQQPLTINAPRWIAF